MTTPTMRSPRMSRLLTLWRAVEAKGHAILLRGRGKGSRRHGWKRRTCIPRRRRVEKRRRRSRCKRCGRRLHQWGWTRIHTATQNALGVLQSRYIRANLCTASTVLINQNLKSRSITIHGLVYFIRNDSQPHSETRSKHPQCAQQDR